MAKCEKCEERALAEKLDAIPKPRWWHVTTGRYHRAIRRVVWNHLFEQAIAADKARVQSND